MECGKNRFAGNPASRPAAEKGVNTYTYSLSCFINVKTATDQALKVLPLLANKIGRGILDNLRRGLANLVTQKSLAVTREPTRMETKIKGNRALKRKGGKMGRVVSSRARFSSMTRQSISVGELRMVWLAHSSPH